MRPFAVPLALAAALLAASAANAVNFGALQSQANSPGGLTYAEARVQMPGLDQVIFDKADTNGDGVIEGSEFPMLQSVYRSMVMMR